MGRKFFRLFSWKGASYRIYSTHTDIIIDQIVEQRERLEKYIEEQPEFLTSLRPIRLKPTAPPIAVRMHEASLKTATGPMAAVAGAIAYEAAETAAGQGAREIIIDNGGDLYLDSNTEIMVGLFAGRNKIGNVLGVRVEPSRLPLSLCSSSGLMGHSFSMGQCDLATVVSKDGALADAAATLACNCVKKAGDIDAVLNRVMNISGVIGVLIVKGDRVGIAGTSKITARIASAG